MADLALQNCAGPLWRTHARRAVILTRPPLIIYVLSPRSISFLLFRDTWQVQWSFRKRGVLCVVMGQITGPVKLGNSRLIATPERELAVEIDDEAQTRPAWRKLN